MISAQKLKPALKLILGDAAPLLAFYAANSIWGLKPAIAVTLVVTAIEVAYKLYRKEKLTTIFWFSVGMTVLFGAVDLYSQDSFLFKYEASLTNFVTAIFFGSTLFSGKSILAEFYYKNPAAARVPLTADRVAFFKFLTAVWVLYFLAKSAAYFWIARRVGITQGFVLRAVLGSASFYIMLGLSFVGGRRLFPLFKKWKLLPEATPV